MSLDNAKSYWKEYQVWYYVWVIAKANDSAAGLLSCPPETPVMPPGYIYKAFAAIGDITLNIAAGGGRGAAWIRSGPDQGCVEFAGYLDTQGRLTAPFRIPVIESQTLYVNVDSGSKAESVTVSISGFEFEGC